MHQIISKTLIFITIILATVAIATPAWIEQSIDENKLVPDVKLDSPQLRGDGHFGLFETCGSSGGAKKECLLINKAPGFSKQLKKDLTDCKILSIVAIVFWVLAMTCDFLPQCRLVGGVFYLMGVVLFLACVILFSTKVEPLLKKENHALIALGVSKIKYDYSFYLAIGALVTGAGAGIAGVMSHH